MASTASLMVNAPVVAPLEAGVVLLLLVVAAASTTTILLGLMELAHRAVSEETSVRALTLFDVIGSTTFQASVFIAGLLVEASTGRSATTDPYRLHLAVVSIGLLGFVLRLRVDDQG